MAQSFKVGAYGLNIHGKSAGSTKVLLEGSFGVLSSSMAVTPEQAADIGAALLRAARTFAPEPARPASCRKVGGDCTCQPDCFAERPTDWRAAADRAAGAAVRV